MAQKTLTVPQLVKKFTAFYEHERLLLCSQETVTCPYHKPSDDSLFQFYKYVNIRPFSTSIHCHRQWLQLFSNGFMYCWTQLLTYILTYSVEQSPSCEANRFSASQEIPPILWNPKLHYHSQVPATCPYSEPARSISIPPHPTSWRSRFILSHLHLGVPSGLFLSGFPTKTSYTPLLSPIRATYHAHLIRLNLSSQQYWVRSTDH